MKTKITLIILYILSIEYSYAQVEGNTQFVSIPDSTFEKYLVVNKLDTDGSVDGKMYISDALKVTTIELKQGNVKSLRGIEEFKNLQNLSATFNEIEEVNLSGNILLEYLIIHGNKLTSLNISYNPNLLKISCSQNRLQELDVSNNKKLQYLYCNDNRLKEVNLCNCRDLKLLYCNKNDLGSLDLSDNINLSTVECPLNKITYINLFNNLSLSKLNISDNNLDKIDIKANKVLEKIYCSNNQISKISLGKNLIVLYCHNNLIEETNFNESILIEDLNCENNQFKKIDITSLSQLRYFYGEKNFNLVSIIIPNTFKSNPKLKKDSTAKFIILKPYTEISENYLDISPPPAELIPTNIKN